MGRAEQKKKKRIDFGNIKNLSTLLYMHSFRVISLQTLYGAIYILHISIIINIITVPLVS